MRDVREFHERLCEIGQGILGASRQTGWRAEAARVAARAGHRRAGGPSATDGRVDRCERMYEGSLTFV